MIRVVVTGGSGKAGRAVVGDLIEHGIRRTQRGHKPPPTTSGRFLRADLTDVGQTAEVLTGADAVDHLAAIPAPGP